LLCDGDEVDVSVAVDGIAHGGAPSPSRRDVHLARAGLNGKDGLQVAVVRLKPQKPSPDLALRLARDGRQDALVEHARVVVLCQVRQEVEVLEGVRRVAREAGPRIVEPEAEDALGDVDFLVGVVLEQRVAHKDVVLHAVAVAPRALEDLARLGQALGPPLKLHVLDVDKRLVLLLRLRRRLRLAAAVRGRGRQQPLIHRPGLVVGLAALLIVRPRKPNQLVAWQCRQRLRSPAGIG
jgi:hypothetical protein